MDLEAKLKAKLKNKQIGVSNGSVVGSFCPFRALIKPFGPNHERLL